MSVAAITGGVESAVGDPHEGPDLDDLALARPQGDGRLKLCLASATIGCAPSGRPFGRGCAALARHPGGGHRHGLGQFREGDLALERDPDRRADQAGAGHAGEHAGREPAQVHVPASARGEAAPERSRGGSRPGSADRPRGPAGIRPGRGAHASTHRHPSPSRIGAIDGAIRPPRGRAGALRAAATMRGRRLEINGGRDRLPTGDPAGNLGGLSGARMSGLRPFRIAACPARWVQAQRHLAMLDETEKCSREAE